MQTLRYFVLAHQSNKYFHRRKPASASRYAELLFRHVSWSKHEVASEQRPEALTYVILSYQFSPPPLVDFAFETVTTRRQFATVASSYPRGK
jgi:hypothetical protein